MKGTASSPIGALVVALLVGACSRPSGEARLTAEEAGLARRIQGLEALIKSADDNGGRIVRFDDLLIVIRQKLIQELLDTGLPLSAEIGGRYRVTASAASVLLEDGFAIVELRGDAELLRQAGVGAEVTVYGALDVVDLDAGSGVLKGRFRIYAVEARTTEVLGISVPAERLVEEISREKLEAFAPLLSSVTIPVRLASAVTLPAMGPEGGVKIAEERIPLDAVVADVKSFRHRLWISVATRPRGAR